MNELSCPECGETFKAMYKLRSHMILHEQDKVYKCEFCGKLFSKSSNLNSHIRTHTGEKPYQCMLCEKYFPRMNNLRSHIMRLHQIDRANADCYIRNEGREGSSIPVVKSEPEPGEKNKPETDKKSESKIETAPTNKMEMVGETSTYTVHIVESHAYFKNAKQPENGVMETVGKRHVYTCKTCNKTMHHRSNMVDHCRTHSGVKLYRCALCYKGLSRKQNVIHHLRYVHFIECDNMADMVIKDSGHSASKSSSDCKLVDQSLSQVSNEVLQLLNKANHENEDDNEEFDDESQSETNSQTNKKSYAVIKAFAVNPKPSSAENLYNTYMDMLSKHSTNGYGTNNEYDTQSDMPEDTNNTHTEDVVETDIKHTDTQVSDTPTATPGTSTGDLPYMVLFPGDPDLRTYQCKFCDFQCRESAEQMEKHVETHKQETHEAGQPEQIEDLIQTNRDFKVHKQYQCAVCCEYFSSQFELRGHLMMKHTLSGAELEEVMALTGAALQGFDNDETGTTEEQDQSSTQHVNDDNESVPMDLDDSKMDSIDTKDTIMNLKKEIEFGGEGNESLENMFLQKRDFPSSSFTEIIQTVNAMNGFADGFVGNSKTIPSINGLNNFNKKRKSSMKHDDSDQDESDISKDSVNIDDGLEHSTDVLDDNIDGSMLNSAVNPAILNMDTVTAWVSTNELALQMLSKTEIDEIVNMFMDNDNLICKKCNKKCSNKSNLKQHVRFVHLALKEFICVVCKKKFNTKYNLKVHWRQHPVLGERVNEFGCETCGKYFMSQNYLESHIALKHPQNTK